jgi:hypothetical protein
MSRTAKHENWATKAVSVPAEGGTVDYCDPVIEAYKKDVDRTLLRENLKLTVEERFQKFERFMEFLTELRAAGRPKDLEAIAQLQALLEERRNRDATS